MGVHAANAIDRATTAGQDSMVTQNHAEPESTIASAGLAHLRFNLPPKRGFELAILLRLLVRLFPSSTQMFRAPRMLMILKQNIF